MSKDNYVFNFNCSKNYLIAELDKLKVLNTDNSSHTNLVCRRINNQIKFMLYTNNAPGNKSYYKTILDEFIFEGNIFEDGSVSYISGSFKCNLFVKFFTVVGFIFTFAIAIMTLTDGFVILPVVLLPVIFGVGMFYYKSNTLKRILVKIKEFEKNLNYLIKQH